MAFEPLGYIAEEYLSNIAHDICRSDDNGNTRDHCHQPLLPPNAKKNGKLGYEPRETGHTHRDQATDNKAYRSKRHHFVHTAKFGNLACMGTIIDHSNDRKEESCHYTMRKHLQTRAKQTFTIKCGKSQHHQSHV